MCGLEQKGTRYARLFTPGISKEEYVAMTVEIEGLSSSALMRVALAFLRKSSLEKKEAERRKLIEELEEMIEQYKNEGGEEEK